MEQYLIESELEVGQIKEYVMREDRGVQGQETR